MSLRELSKRAILAGSRRAGVNWCLRTALSHRLLVLCYHSVIPDDCPERPCTKCVVGLGERACYRMRDTIKVGEFRRQLAVICRLFRPVSATDVLDHLERGRPLPLRAVLLTFDDGFRNNLACAAPVMLRMGVPALICVVTDHVGKPELLWPQELDERIFNWNHAKLPMPGGQADVVLSDEPPDRCRVADRIRQFCKRLPNQEKITYLNRLRQDPLSAEEQWIRQLYAFLSWEEIRELDRSGFKIGSHTVTHPILTTLSPAHLAAELRNSKAAIERELQKPCPCLAYPNGGKHDVSPEVVAAARNAGYRMAFNLMGRPNPERLRPLEIERVSMSGKLSEDGLYARLNGLIPWLS